MVLVHRRIVLKLKLFVLKLDKSRKSFNLFFQVLRSLLHETQCCKFSMALIGLEFWYNQRLDVSSGFSCWNIIWNFSKMTFKYESSLNKLSYCCCSYLVVPEKLFCFLNFSTRLPSLLHISRYDRRLYYIVVFHFISQLTLLSMLKISIHSYSIQHRFMSKIHLDIKRLMMLTDLQ